METMVENIKQAPGDISGLFNLWMAKRMSNAFLRLLLQ